MPTDLRIELVKFGKNLLTRDRGERVRDQAIAALDDGRNLVIDFRGVDSITPSFADELLGEVAERLGIQAFRERIQLLGASRDIRHLIAVVIANRLARTAAATSKPNPNS